MLLKVEISDEDVDKIVVLSLKGTLETHISTKDADSPEIIAACHRLIEYYSPPPWA
jgi:hypothetical protein